VEFNGFTFILTDDCNYRCTYCQHKKVKSYLSKSHIESALEYFYPYFSEECYINFYGGEPLLAFPAIRNIVFSLEEKNRTHEKRIHYTISTNGSLMDEDVFRFFIRYNISPLLSFDGYAQDITREKGTFDSSVALIKKIQASEIDLLVNSVFTPETVKFLSKSMRLLMDMGVKNIDLSLSTVDPWDETRLEELEAELANLRKSLFSFYKRTKTIPINKFSKSLKKGVFQCAAGRDRMTLAPDGKLWGCHLFSLYLSGKESTRQYQKYCFGDVEHFFKNLEQIYPKILMNYAELRMDCFYTPKEFCLFCEEIEDCGICPSYAALSSGVIKEIPLWICEIKKIFRKEKSKLWKELGALKKEGKAVTQQHQSLTGPFNKPI
jgi:sulfatase maturation enzyme AslB (radical SAM superfamily)